VANRLLSSTVGEVAVTITIAHRGDPVAERENTLASFAAAMDEGADMIEIDLHCTRDAAIVVVHDPTLTRLWGVDRAVADLDLSEVREVGGGADRIPTLDDVLRAVDIPVMVDFTGPEVVDGALEVVRHVDAMDRCLFVTGHVDALRQLRARAPEARIGLTWTEEDAPATALLQELGAEFWNPWFRRVTAERVTAVHDLGIRVSTWTVDERRHMERVSAAGVDAIVSNRIGDLRRYLGSP
jgi:glycerophosphoryl diester phosphodiesterase